MSVLNNNRHSKDKDYNCATYALNVPMGGWTGFDTFDTDEITYLSTGGISDEEIYNLVLEDMSKELLFKFATLRRIRNKADYNSIDKNKEEIIQLRIRLDHETTTRCSLEDNCPTEEKCSNCNFFTPEEYTFSNGGDFHFRVLRNGVWMEKCGSTPVQSCEPWKDDFDNIPSDFGISYIVSHPKEKEKEKEDDEASHNNYLSQTIVFAKKIVQI